MQQEPFRKQHNSAAGCGNREQTCALKRQSDAQKECQRTRDGRLRGLNDCRKGHDCQLESGWLQLLPDQ